jgi:hypothetical protein
VFGLPNPYLIGGAALAFLLATSGAYITGRVQGGKASNARWEAVRTQERLDAATIQAFALQRARDAENRAAEAARTIEAEHNEAIALASRTRDDFARRLRLAQAGSCRSNGVPPDAPSAGVGADATPGSDSGPGSGNPGLSLRDAALSLQAYAVACHKWALENGR